MFSRYIYCRFGESGFKVTFNSFIVNIYFALIIGKIKMKNTQQAKI